MKHLLEYDSLELSFGDKKVLSSIYMKCETGEIVGLLGRNGTGKSSLMKIVFGALDAGHRHVRINGEAIHGYSKLIAYLPQEKLIPDYLAIGKAFKLFKVDFDEIAETLPALREFQNFKPGQISGGYVRLVEAILILRSEARFCILDEPFSGLMPVHIETRISLMKVLKNEKGIIITDHLYRHVSRVSDRMYLLSNGKTYPINNVEQLISLGYVNAL
jgi:ABC-type multidrug transport system ATPase subunit